MIWGEVEAGSPTIQVVQTRAGGAEAQLVLSSGSSTAAAMEIVRQWLSLLVQISGVGFKYCECSFMTVYEFELSMCEF